MLFIGASNSDNQKYQNHSMKKLNQIEKSSQV